METTALQKKREKYATALDVAFRKILTMLRAMPEVQQVILFGSYGKGRRDLFTDIDLLVIMESDEKFIDRTARVYSQIQAGVDLDLLVYTPDELERNNDRPFIRNILRTGKVVYEKAPT